MIGQKPKAFCLWLFAWLGAEPGDELDDRSPGSGQVREAWVEWMLQPALPLVRSPAAEKRAQRRELKKALAVHPALLEDARATD